ncbi:type IV pilin N-terminal domain-containing protein [Methanoregula formicica]|uniref:Archaeal Type IV pilin N-terminal domain-containing protein n=1 Tax=Methanoregula formicica (strain DSM 22288 / NBRC 105244 / SMSP) TaxID=593750 RepID=L0HCW0_METFS|nr:type IV pilin N-terminal domain-containing protein [Methanoregula formicica]AGB01855.1 Protein of unknown function (DUF1628) [Methanoregula formicica SMSP]
MMIQKTGRMRGQATHGTGDGDGVSEVIGAVLLISLVVTAVALVAVFVNSQATPRNIPDVNFMVGSDNRNPLTLYLTHNGGDILPLGSFSVYVDGTMRAYSLSGGGNEWSLGKNLVVPLSSGEKPGTIILVYNATGSGGSVIGSASADVSVPSVTAAPEIIIPPSVCVNITDPQIVLSVVLNNVSVIGDAMNQSPSTVGPVIANVVGANSISFYREGKATIDPNTHLSLNITGAGSTISYGTTTSKSLGIGDILVVTLSKSSPGSWKIFGLGNQIWEFSAADSSKVVDISWKHKSNGTWTNTSATQLFHTWITGYQDVGSTLTVRSTGGSYYTALAVNGTMVIDGVNSSTVVIQNIRPVGVGLFVLEYDPNSDSMYFVGNAQSVSVT